LFRYLVIFCLCLITPFARADFDHAMALYQNQDYPKAFTEFETLAKTGDHAAQFNLGVMYYKGQHVPRDLARGYAWMVLSTQGGDPQWSGMRDKVYAAFDEEEKSSADQARREISEQFSDAMLKGESAVIILNAVSYRYMLDTLIFAMIDSDNRFSIKFDVVRTDADIYIVRAKPGRYYLRTVGLSWANVANTPLEQPENINETILVVSGAATYIGDWRAYEHKTNDSQKPLRYEVKTEYSNDTVIRAGKIDPALRQLPLFLSKPGAPLVAMTWD
jgi:hypothetical protein